MGYFALVIDGVVKNVAVADSEPEPEIVGTWIDVSAIDPRPGVFCTYENGIFSFPEPPVVKTFKSIKNIWMKIRIGNAFLNVEEAAKSDSSVADWLNAFNAKNEFDLTAPETKTQLDFLVSKNFIDSSHAAYVLSQPGSEAEQRVRP